MTWRKRAFPLLVLAFCFFLAAFVSPFASDLPDGLEKVASDLGFREKETANVNVIAIAPDYAIPGVSNAKVAKSFAGALGALAALAVGAGAGYLMASRARR
jgi:cobalt/nickel transport protein